MPYTAAADVLKIKLEARLKTLQRGRQGLKPLSLDEMTDIDKSLTHLLEKIAEPYDVSARAIEGDVNLSSVGKAKAREKLARQTLDQLAKFEEKHVIVPRAQVAAKSAAFLKRGETQRPTNPAELAIYVAKLRHLWDTFAKADPLQMDLIAMTTTDPLILDALATAPPVFRQKNAKSFPELTPVVPAEKIRAVAESRARQQDPATALELERVEMVASEFAGSINSVKAAITEHVKSIANDMAIQVLQGAKE